MKTFKNNYILTQEEIDIILENEKFFNELKEEELIEIFNIIENLITGDLKC